MLTLPVLLLLAGAAPAKSQRIDLVDDARVVRYTGETPETLQVQALERGVDGYDAWVGPDGRYMIGVEWDEPRDLAEVNIEFRHAIANREEIRVQYWHRHWPSTQKGGWAALDDPFHGKWVTAKAEWWAGDRDVTFAFVPYHQEQPGKDAPDVRYRRTCRLRFLLGKGELPPVRYLRAYGPNKPAQATFDLLFDPTASVRAPLDASIVNGDLLEEEDGKTTTTQTTQLGLDSSSLSVRYAVGDTETPTRTIVTLRDVAKPEHGISFVPAEVVQYGQIKIPAVGVTVRHHGGNPVPSPASQPTYYDRIPQQPEQTWERARREIPPLQKTRQRSRPLYLPLGPPNARQEIAVNYDGSIHLDKTSLKVPAADTIRLNWPADSWYIKLRSGQTFDQSKEGAVKQRLLDGYLPVVINEWDADGVHYEQTSVATYLDGDPKEPKGDEAVALLSQFVMKNASQQPATATLRLSLTTGEQIAYDRSEVYATGIRKKGQVEPYPNRQYRFSILRKDTPQVTGSYSLVESDDSLRCEVSLKPGEVWEMGLLVPFIALQTQKEQDKLLELGLAFGLIRDAEALRWRKIVAEQAEIQVPDPLLNDFYKANLTHILITADRDPFNGTSVLPAATYGYNVCLNESCHQIRSLDLRGLHKEAGKYLDAIVAGQSSMPLHGRFTDKKGVLHGLPSKDGNYQHFNYNLDHGFALWMLGEHYRLTRDRAWLARVSDAMIAACDFITRQRTTTQPESNTLAKADTYWGQGLLPPGHLEDPPEWLWWLSVNAYAFRGMQATVDALRDVHHPEAERIALDAQEFGARLRRSCQEAMLRAPAMRHSDGTYWPFQPTRSRLRRRDLGWIRDALYGPVHLIDCGVFPPDSPEAEWILRDAEDNVFLSDDRGRHLDAPENWFSWGGITIQSNLLPNPLVYLQRSQPQYAIRAFWNSLAANVYEDVRTFCEHPVNRYGEGAGPFFKTPDESAFIVWFRHLLVMESGSGLDLLAGVPQDWLVDGKRIHIKGSATWFGPLSLDVESSANELTVKLSSPARNPPEKLRLHNRRPGRVRSVTLNGQPVEAYDAKSAVLTLPVKSGEMKIVFRY